MSKNSVAPMSRPTESLTLADIRFEWSCQEHPKGIDTHAHGGDLALLLLSGGLAPFEWRLSGLVELIDAARGEDGISNNAAEFVAWSLRALCREVSTMEVTSDDAERVRVVVAPKNPAGAA